ncbi:MAG: PadR family transcriptional regulator [Candidatus Omnitrophota bacterium]|nr:MAG: PadR family transcriptional regulator [Candidatus Omnitrophota bacterium]
MLQDLVLLGLLKEGPKHGYEIRKTIDQVLNTFANVDSKSIYYPLRKLEKKGLVDKKPARKGKRPEKFIYKITKEGEKIFERLLNDNFLTFQRPSFNVDLSLYFLPLVKQGLAQSRLRSRLRGMKRIMRWLKERKATLKENVKSYHLLTIIEHQIRLTKADIAFTKSLIETLNPPK